MRIAILCSRGIPAAYGGFETFAEELATQLVTRGHDVAVYCEPPPEGPRPDRYKGVELVYFPVRPPKNYRLRKLYELVYDVYSYLRMARRCDVMYLLAPLGTPLLFIPKLLNRRLRIAANIDGIEWKRAKYNRLEGALFKWFVDSAVKYSDLVVLDAEAMRNHVQKEHLAKTIVSPYGVHIPTPQPWDPALLARLASKHPDVADLRPREYWLVVARLQPDNHTHTIIEGYLKSGTKKPLVVVGGFWSSGYEAEIENILGGDVENRVHLVGGIYDRELLTMLRQHCFGYIHGHSAGGTNPSLLEAMAAGNPIVAHDNEFNREVCGTTGRYFSGHSNLAEALRAAEASPTVFLSMGRHAKTRAAAAYGWPGCIVGHENAFVVIAH